MHKIMIWILLYVDFSMCLGRIRISSGNILTYSFLLNYIVSNQNYTWNPESASIRSFSAIRSRTNPLRTSTRQTELASFRISSVVIRKRTLRRAENPENIHSTGSAPTIPSQTNGTKGTPSSFLLTKIVKNPDIRRKILRFASNSHTFHTRPKVGTTRAPKINFRILPALAIFAEDRMRFGNFQEQVLIIALGFRYLCRR